MAVDTTWGGFGGVLPDLSEISAEDFAAHEASTSLTPPPSVVSEWNKPLVTAAPKDTALDIPPAPEPLTVDPFVVPKGGTVAEQFSELSSKDSALTRSAKRLGGESATAMGQSRSSLAAGSAGRELKKAITPIAMADAKTVTDAAMIGWSEGVKQSVNEYNLAYRGRLDALGYDNNRIGWLMTHNTSLINTLSSVANNLLSNIDIANSEELVNWVTDNITALGQESLVNIAGYDFTA